MIRNLLNFKFLFLAFLIFSYNTSRSQNEFSKWYFGGYAGLDFSTSPPTLLTNGAMTTSEGVATISDGMGNLLFYTDGITVFNSSHVSMSNGGSLNGNPSSTQSALIVRQPGSSNIYYIFTTPGAGPACYSIVDMSLAAGLGSVTVKNATLFSPATEKQVAIRHCNGKDIWIVTHAYNSDQFKSFLLSSAGVNTVPVISAIGEAYTNSPITVIGHMKSSPDGKKLAISTSTNSLPQSNGMGGFHLFDFDASSGAVSNSLTLRGGEIGAYGLEFSPDGKMLYGSLSPISNVVTKLFQWNICATNTAAIIASEYSISLGNQLTGALQRAIDGKIYLAVAGQQSLSVINNPNSSGSAMNFVANALSLSPKQSGAGLPNFINGYTKNVPASFPTTLACQSVSFTIPAAVTFSSGCSSIPYPYSGYKWDFGDAASAMNSSTLSSLEHNFTPIGTYTVKLIMYSNCSNDTISKVINITAPGPSITVNGLMNVCKGEKRIYTAAGGTTYQWSNNTTASTVALTSTATRVYSVTGYAGGCKTTEVFTVTVNPCLGVSTEESDETLSVFPNPFSESILIESLSGVEVIISDVNGKILGVRKFSSGQNSLDTSDLKPGRYIIQTNSKSGSKRAKMLKVE